MVKFEAIRIDPTPGEVVDLISEAVLAANRRCRTRLIEDDSVKWRKATRQFQKSADGWEMWRAGLGGVPATQVMLSWWTDLVGRKHAVVRGRRAESYGDKSFLERSTLEKRPALWHCYPDRMYLRTMKAGKDWIVVCDCGAAGTPSSLGWMGTACGPCHDVAMERGESHARLKNAMTFAGSKEELARVAISPDNKFLACTDMKDAIHLWSRNEAINHSFSQDFTGFRTRTLGFTGNSKSLIVDNFVSLIDCISFDVTSEPPKEFPIYPVGHIPLFVLPWIDGTFCRVRQDGLEWVDPKTNVAVRLREIPIGDAWQVIPSPDCSRLFVRVGNRCTIIDPSDGQILVRPEIWDRDGFLFRDDFPVHVAFSQDFKRIAIGLHMRLNLIDGMTGRQIKNVLVPSYPFTQEKNPQMITGLAFDASGELLYVCTFNGNILVYRSADLSPIASFKWHMSDTRAFAASNDAKTLLTGGSEGIVKLWPIERLMATVEV